MSDFDSFTPRAKKPFLVMPEDIAEESGGPGYVEAPRATEAERLLAAELIVFLEDELSVDCQRVRLQVRAGTVFLQGTVESDEQRKMIEEMLLQRPQVKALESALTIQPMEF